MSNPFRGVTLQLPKSWASAFPWLEQDCLLCAGPARGAVTKGRETEPQPGLRRRERRANLRKAFRCRLAFSGEHVAVVDDVITTGTTADEIAKVLKAAGAGRVSAWAVARTPDPAMR